MKRRAFIKNTSLASSLVFVPSFVNAFDGILQSSLGHKKLVIIQLEGGNDGLNTIVPYRNDLYFKNRPTLALKSDKLIKATDDVGFHLSLKPLKNLYDKGYVSILNNVGYPNPNRSHFRSMDIWQTASRANQSLTSGWIGRFLDANGNRPYDAIEVDDSLSLAMKGETMSAIATNNAERFFKTSQEPYFKQIIKHHSANHLSEHNLGYLYKTLIAAESSAKHIYETSRTFTSKQSYPNTEFAKQLKTTAEFINSGLETKVYYTSLNGFDTHANQINAQSRLLSQYAEAVESFVNDLKQNNTFKDTLILTFSEFGRRVKQNAANGTDHGAANNVFVISENLKTQGFYNKLASLEDLDGNGDVKYEIDFRTVYATILRKWLNVDDQKILNHNFEQLHFI
jgi:uncharacterized protein (DUF1501 family)